MQRLSREHYLGGCWPGSASKIESSRSTENRKAQDLSGGGRGRGNNSFLYLFSYNSQNLPFSLIGTAFAIRQSGNSILSVRFNNCYLLQKQPHRNIMNEIHGKHFLAQFYHETYKSARKPKILEVYLVHVNHKM